MIKVKYFIIYLIIINLYGIYIMNADKRKAREGKWRTPEAHLFIIAIIFGSPGILIGMNLFHHKTKHMKFIIGIPLILIIQLYVLFKVRYLFL